MLNTLLTLQVGATMVGGSISDIFETKDRGTPMNLFGVGSLTGTGLGPFVAGFIYSNHKLGWRYPPRPSSLIVDGYFGFN